ADSPQLLPDGDSLLFTLAKGPASDRWDKANVVIVSRKTGERKVLFKGAEARYLPTGHIVYAVGQNVLAVPFDIKRVEIKPGPIPVLENVLRHASIVTGAANFDISSDGTLAYIPSGPSGYQRILALIDRTGNIQPLSVSPASYDIPRLSR